MLNEYLSCPGEHVLSLSGSAGLIEAIISVPQSLASKHFALLGHPHSLQGGSMTNKVVTTLARCFRDLGIPSLRFNFRGVGQSAGVYDAGIGESEDMLACAALVQLEYPEARFVFAGFSFGSYVTYRAAGQFPHELLISIAPPVHHYDYLEFKMDAASWVIAQGEADEVVPSTEVFAFFEQHYPIAKVLHFPDTGHFFHSKLIDLKAQLEPLIKQQLGL